MTKAPKSPSRNRTRKARNGNRRLRPWERARARLSRSVCGQIDYEGRGSAPISPQDLALSSDPSASHRHRCVVDGESMIPAVAGTEDGHVLQASIGLPASESGFLPWRPQRLTHAQIQSVHRVRHLHMLGFLATLVAFLGVLAWLVFAVHLHLG